MAWTPMLKGMVLLKQYTKDDKIFSPAKDPTHRFGKDRKVEVWWDPPLPAPPKLPYGCKIGDMTNFQYAMTTHVKQDMVFACTINNQSALALIDSGASDTFVTAKMVKGSDIKPNMKMTANFSVMKSQVDAFSRV